MPPREPLVLVVDDEPFVGRLIRLVLSEAGVGRVKTVLTAQAMWQVLKHETPDVLLLDIALPDANGLTLLRTLKRVPELAEVPVIVMTGIAELPADSDELKHAAGVMAKPLAPRQLVAEVLAVLGERVHDEATRQD